MIQTRQSWTLAAALTIASAAALAAGCTSIVRASVGDLGGSSEGTGGNGPSDASGGAVASSVAGAKNPGGRAGAPAASDSGAGPGGARAIGIGISSGAGSGGIIGSSGAGSGGIIGGAGSGVIGGDGGGGGSIFDGPLLIPVDGWVDGASNVLGIQGAIFAYADPTSVLSMVSNFTGSQACFKGIAARVDFNSEACVTKMFTAPATDCYGEFWGAAIGLNLNQPVDPATMAGSAPEPFDASALLGFAFELSGGNLPARTDLRFQVETAITDFCSVPTTKLSQGVNQVLFSDLVSGCFKSPIPTAPTAETAKSSLIKLAWYVVTNSSNAVPYDFCVSNIRALLQ